MSGYDITDVVNVYLAEEVILDSNSSQGLEFFGLGCSL